MAARPLKASCKSLPGFGVLIRLYRAGYSWRNHEKTLLAALLYALAKDCLTLRAGECARSIASSKMFLKPPWANRTAPLRKWR